MQVIWIRTKMSFQTVSALPATHPLEFEQVLYRLLSGMHASINIHINLRYLDLGS